MNIRNATIEDLEGIANVLEKAYHENYAGVGELLFDSYEKEKKVKAFRKDFPKEISRYRVMEENGKIIGFISFVKFENMISLLNASVLPEDQGKGIGTQLINQFKEESKELRLDVNEKNEAMKLYEKLGFKIVLKDIGMVWKKW